jgi:hypothetical protein
MVDYGTTAAKGIQCQATILKEGFVDMSSDLEKFLQQAAERLRDKLQQGQQAQRPSSSSTQPPSPPRPTQRPTHRSNPSEVVEARVVRSLRESGPDPLSTIDTRPSVGHDFNSNLAHEIGQADEKMAGHLHQVFDHRISNLPRASEALQASSPRTSQTDEPIGVDRRENLVSPLIKMLRNPTTLRAAFLASEVFNRKF